MSDFIAEVLAGVVEIALDVIIDKHKEIKERKAKRKAENEAKKHHNLAAELEESMNKANKADKTDKAEVSIRE